MKSEKFVLYFTACFFVTLVLCCLVALCFDCLCHYSAVSFLIVSISLSSACLCHCSRALAKNSCLQFLCIHTLIQNFPSNRRTNPAPHTCQANTVLLGYTIWRRRFARVCLFPVHLSPEIPSVPCLLKLKF